MNKDADTELEAGNAHKVTVTTSPSANPGRRVRDLAFEGQEAFAQVWASVPVDLDQAQTSEVLTAWRVVKALAVALARGDTGGLGHLNRAASKVLSDSVDGPLLGSEAFAKKRPEAVVFRKADGAPSVLFYGNVPDQGARPGSRPWDGAVDADDGSGLTIVRGADIHEGRFAVARSFAQHLRLVHTVMPDKFLDRLVGRAWQGGVDVRWPEMSLMHDAAKRIDEAAIVSETSRLFAQKRDIRFELGPEFEVYRARLRDVVKNWQQDLECRGASPTDADYESLVRKGLRALGADADVVNNLFKAPKQKARRARADDETELEGARMVTRA